MIAPDLVKAVLEWHMITTKEARALYDESGAEAKALLKTFEPKIIEAAKSGKNR